MPAKGSGLLLCFHGEAAAVGGERRHDYHMELHGVKSYLILELKCCELFLLECGLKETYKHFYVLFAKHMHTLYFSFVLKQDAGVSTVGRGSCMTKLCRYFFFFFLRKPCPQNGGRPLLFTE